MPPPGFPTDKFDDGFFLSWDSFQMTLASVDKHRPSHPSSEKLLIKVGGGWHKRFTTGQSIDNWLWSDEPQIRLLLDHPLPTRLRERHKR